MAPTLVLQPLVENAIRHGIEPGEKAGTVRVTASRKDETLLLTVEDDGVGLGGRNGGSPWSSNVGTLNSNHSPSAQKGTGIGLANLRERLKALYGARQQLELKSRPGGGVIVRIEIPWRPSASSEPSNTFVS
jgi:sensor histidine kinase YesM